MGANRVFFPQEALDEWMVDERVTITNDMMTLKPDGRTFKLESALRFICEVAGGGDAKELTGKALTMERVAEMGGEHCANSVLLEDDAYDVVEGFLCEPMDEPVPAATGDDMVSATRAAAGDSGAKKEPDPLTEWFLQKR